MVMNESPPSGLIASLFTMPLGVIAQAAREAIVVIDAEQRIVAVNPAAQRLFQWTASQTLGQPLTMLIPPAFRATHGELVRKFKASGAIEAPMDTRSIVTGLRADGQEFPAEAAISRLDLFVDGQPREFFVALMRDLSQERALESFDEAERLVNGDRGLLAAIGLVGHDADADLAALRDAWAAGDYRRVERDGHELADLVEGAVGAGTIRLLVPALGALVLWQVMRLFRRRFLWRAGPVAQP